jgi:signal transduction histidine kinase
VFLFMNAEPPMAARLSFMHWPAWLLPPLNISLSPAERQRTERVIAAARFVFSGISLVAVWLDPALLASNSPVIIALMALHFAAASLMGVRLRGTYVPTRRAQAIWHAGDLMWAAMLTLMTVGPNSPFSLVFMFVLPSAAYRWGFVETIGTAAFAVAVVVAQFLLTSDASAGSQAGWSHINPLLLRTLYVSAAGGLLGYLAEEERYRRIETTVAGRLVPKIHAETDVWVAFEAAAAEILSLFSAHTLLVLLTETRSGRQSVWTAARERTGAMRIDSCEIAASEADRYRLDLPGAAWHINRGLNPMRPSRPRVLALDADGRRINAAPLRLPAEWVTRHPADAMLGVTVTVAGMGSAVMLLFDPRSGSASALRFVQRLANQLARAISSLYLLQRLRSRVGALERARIARELHDGVIQSLIGLQMQVDALQRSPRDTAAVVSGLGRIQELLAREVHDLRDVMHHLEPVDFRPRDLVPHLQELVASFERETGISARFVSDVDEVTLSPGTCHELARITREALVNARKHSGARNVFVRFIATPSEYRLVIDNDGRLFDFEGRLSHAELDRTRKGPAVIKARVRAIGGELTIDSVRDEGVRLEVTVPRTALVQQRTA